MSNEIPHKQNDAEQVQRLKAQRTFYRRAKLALGIQTICVIMLPLVSAQFSGTDQKLKVWILSLSIAFTLLDAIVIKVFIRHCKEMGAKNQELFDCSLFDLPWHSLRAGKKPVYESTIVAARRYKESMHSPVKDWYPKIVGEIPIEYARLICQRTNCHWDQKLRAGYVLCNWALLLVIAAYSIISGIINDYTFPLWVTMVVAPLMPAIILLIRLASSHKEASRRSEHLHNYVEEIWRQMLAGQCQNPNEVSRDIQSEIFIRRKHSPLIFDWVYAVTRGSGEETAEQTASRYVEEYRQAIRQRDL